MSLAKNISIVKDNWFWPNLALLKAMHLIQSEEETSTDNKASHRDKINLISWE